MTMTSPSPRFFRAGGFFFFCVFFVLAAGGCAPSLQDRALLADRLAAAAGWQRVELAVPPFVLTAYDNAAMQTDILTVFIEGDGMAWRNGLPPENPTPRNPMVLRMALAHPDGGAAYLARPCQYVVDDGAACDMRYWTDARFAPEVVAATGMALDRLKTRHGARYLALVGYSGGGAVAALVAAGREDVLRLVTVAGNLDHAAWTAHHGVAALASSLNPVDAAARLAQVPQWHFVGAQDKVVPPDMAYRFVARGQAGVVRPVAGYGHGCCWDTGWPALWRRLPRLGN